MQSGALPWELRSGRALEREFRCKKMRCRKSTVISVATANLQSLRMRPRALLRRLSIKDESASHCVPLCDVHRYPGDDTTPSAAPRSRPTSGLRRRTYATPASLELRHAMDLCYDLLPPCPSSRNMAVCLVFTWPYQSSPWRHVPLEDKKNPRTFKSLGTF